MTVAFVKKSRDEIMQYTRLRPANYRSSSGTIAEASPNIPRLNYDINKNFMGMMFGDGDTAKIPTIQNPHWNSSESLGGTFVIIGQAPQGVTWFKCGSGAEVVGIDAHKLHIIEIPPNQVSQLEEYVQLFPNADDVDGDCHVLLVKYYTETGIDFGVEKEAMTEFNDFLHGAWK